MRRYAFIAFGVAALCLAYFVFFWHPVVRVITTTTGLNSVTAYELTPSELNDLKTQVGRGDSEAAIRIAYYYWQFVGDEEEALKWLNKARRLGNKMALGMYDSWNAEYLRCQAAETRYGRNWSNVDKLRPFVKADPATDVRSAIDAGDLRFVEVVGFAKEAPGVDDRHAPLITKYGFRIIEGTSDCPATDEERRLNQQARDYAAQYNKLLVQHLDPASDPGTR